MDELWRKAWFKAAAGAIAFIGFLWLVYTVRVALLPFCAAFVLAYLFDPVIDRLEEKKVNRTLAIIFLLFLLSLAALAFTALVAPMVMEQVETLGKKLPGYVDSLEKKISPLLDKLPDQARENWKAKAKEAITSMGDLPLRAVQAAAKGLWSGLTGAMGLMAALINLVLIPVATFYLLRDFDHITAAASKRIPAAYKERTLDIIVKIDNVLSGFFRGQMIVALFMATVLSIGLFVIGVPMGLLIGLVAGLSNIVPYLAIFIGLGPALLMAWIGIGDWQSLVQVALLFAGANAIEGFIVTPKVLEGSVGLHPVAVMAALLVGGAFFGFIGVVLAVPVAAVLKVLIGELDKAYLASDLLGARPAKKK